MQRPDSGETNTHGDEPEARVVSSSINEASATSQEKAIRDVEPSGSKSGSANHLDQDESALKPQENLPADGLGDLPSKAESTEPAGTSDTEPHLSASVTASSDNPPTVSNNAELTTASSTEVDYLLADDNRVIQRLYSKYMGNLELPYHMAADGQQAVDMYKAKPYKVVLLDISMPVLSGLDAATYIREYEQQNGIAPAVIVAVTPEPRNVSAKYEGKFDLFFKKPYSSSHLKDLLESRVPGVRVKK